MSIEPVPGWMLSGDGLHAEDLDHLPGLPPHAELIDGGLVLMNPQRLFHMRIIRRLEAGLLATVPPDLEVLREMSVVFGRYQRTEPDVFVIDAASIGGDDQTWYPPTAVRLAVEVVSKTSESDDRKRKPQLYAGAGIPHFWRVEEDAGHPVVYVYELDAESSAYTLTGIFLDRLKLAVPYSIDIDLVSNR